MKTQFAFNAPINTVSFGNVSVSLLREMYKLGLTPNIFVIGQNADMSAQKPDEKFNQWLGHCINKAQKEHSRKNTAFKLWHINGSLETYSDTDSRLITFHETDSLTPSEVNILKNQSKIYVTSKFTKSVFESFGISATYLPLGFDSHNFGALEKRPQIDGVTQWGLAGKFEVRKSHPKVLNLWAKKYGNRKEHRLNVAVANPFLKQEHLNALINQSLEGKQYWNINFIPYMATNLEYNNFLQANSIHLALSGGEGFDLPAFHATALGAHTVAMRAHVYNDYLNDDNAVLINPNSKRPAADGIFFHPNSPFNTGNFFDFAEDDFYQACEKAEQRASQGLNNKGLELQKQGYSQAVQVLLADS